MIDTIELVPTFKSVRISSERESSVKRGRVLVSRISGLSFERGRFGIYRGHLGGFPCNE